MWCTKSLAKNSNKPPKLFSKSKNIKNRGRGPGQLNSNSLISNYFKKESNPDPNLLRPPDHDIPDITDPNCVPHK